MSNIRKAFRTTKVKANSFPKEAQDQIEMLFMGLEAGKTDAVNAERTAGIHISKASQKRQQAQAAELELLQYASEYSNQLAGERVWLVYRDKEGIVTFEGVTERLLRNNFRAQQEMLGRNLAENSDDDVDRTGMYEDNETEDGGDPSSQN